MAEDNGIDLLKRVEYNGRELLERNADELKKYFPELKNLPKSLEEINLSNPTKKDLASLVVLYALKNPDEDMTGNKLAEFAGFSDSRQLYGLINKLYEGEIVPDFKGSTIGTLLKDAGFLDSNIFEVAGRKIEIGRKDVTGQIRIPTQVDKNVAWLSGIVTISSYSEGFEEKNSKKYATEKIYSFSFKRDDKIFVELEVVPLIEDLFNYSPQIDKKREKLIRRGKQFYAEQYTIQIAPRSIVSYFRNTIGIHPNQKDRKIIFEDDEELMKAFVGGIVDRCGSYALEKGDYPRLDVYISLKYPKLANGLEKYLGRKLRKRTQCYTIRFAAGDNILKKFEEFRLRNPKWYLPELDKM